MAAIYKFKLMMVPLILLSLTAQLLISEGHFIRHTMLLYMVEVLIHTPPAPILDASMYPTSVISCMTNSFTYVGRFYISIRSRLQSSNAAYARPFLSRDAIFGCMSIVRLKGAHRPRPADNPIATYRILPTNLAKRLYGMEGWRIISLTSKIMASSVAVGSSIQHRVLSKTHSRTSLCMSYNPSPSISLFLETGLPPMCPDILGGGNILCIVCRSARNVC